MEHTFELPNGARILVRPIRPDDKEMLQAGFARLSPASRYRRFFRHIDHLSEAQLRYLTEVDGENHSAYLALRVTEPHEGVGVARWIRLADDRTSAEAAVTVVDDYQSMGVGKTLLYVIARDALEHGITAFKAWVMSDNPAIVRVLQELGGQMGRWSSGMMEVTIPLPSSVEELDRSAAPLVLKAVAEERLRVEADPRRPVVASRVIDHGDQPSAP